MIPDLFRRLPPVARQILLIAVIMGLAYAGFLLAVFNAQGGR